MNKRWLVCVLFPLVLYANDNKTVVGWIIKCAGTWQDNTDASRPVVVDCRLPEPKLWYSVKIDTRLERPQKRLGDFVLFRDAATGQKHKLGCDEPANCSPYPPIKLYVHEKPDQGVISAFLADVGESYTQIRLMQSRSSGSEPGDTIAEYVIAEEGAIKIKEMFRAAAPIGNYVLEICPFNPEGGCPEELKVRKIRREATPSEDKWPDPLKAGLYEIVRVDELDGVPIRTKDRGFLLVVPASDDQKYFGQVQATVHVAEAIFLNDWQDKNEGRQVFEAFLIYLSQQYPR